MTPVPDADAAGADGDLMISRGRLPWEDVARLALHTWPARIVAAALAPRTNELWPALLHRETLSIDLPTWQVQLLQRDARSRRARYQWNKSDIIEDLLADHYELEISDATIPEDVQAAMRFPEGYFPPTLRAARCELCGARLGMFPQATTCRHCRASYGADE